MSLTERPAARSAVAVPPVDTSSTPKPASTRAKSTSPVLSVTLSRARRICFALLLLELTGALLKKCQGRKMPGLMGFGGNGSNEAGEGLTPEYNPRPGNRARARSESRIQPHVGTAFFLRSR